MVHRPYKKSVKLTEIGRAREKNKVSEKKVVTSLPIKKAEFTFTVIISIVS